MDQLTPHETDTLDLSPYFLITAAAFLLLKLFGVVNWSWWIVLAPLYAPFVIVLLTAGILYLTTWMIYGRPMVSFSFTWK